MGCSTRGDGAVKVGSGVYLVRLCQDDVLEPVHEQSETGEEDGDEHDEDSLHTRRLDTPGRQRPTTRAVRSAPERSVGP